MQGTYGNAVEEGVQEMEGAGRMQGIGGMLTCTDALCQGAVENPLQVLGGQWGVFQARPSEPC